MGHGYYSDDSEFAVAIAASAHAIYSLVEAATSQNQNKKANTRREVPSRPSQAGSIGRPPTRDIKISSFLRPASSLVEDQRWIENSNRSKNSHANTDAWEKAQIAKIRKRYEKIESGIQAWENDRKLREKQKMERKKNSLELRKSVNLKHYQNKVARIDQIADGARAQVEEKRKKEEFIVRQRSRKLRSTGKAPVNCFCF